jgi:manganese/zinc/iron transport system substrate-binding protein
MEKTQHSYSLTRRSALLGGLSGFALIASAPLARAAVGVLDVVATTGMIGDAARRVGGAHVSVRNLMGSGVDPHGYRQTRSDIVAMTRADLVLWHGLYLEAQMERFFEDLARKRRVVAVADALPKDLLLSHPSYDGRYDPHVWMAPTLWADVVDEVERALSEALPEQAEAFAANAEAYRAELAALATYAEEALSKVPQAQRVLVTAHDAFSYFGRAFGFEVIGIQGISTNSEAGLNRISELVDVLVEREIGAVFVETSVSDRNMRALVEGAAARGHEVKIGGSLFSDAMGEPDSYEGTYIGMIDHNVTTIARALGADIEPGGMSGQLGQGS